MIISDLKSQNRTMKRLTEYKKLFNVTTDTDLATLKTIYRNLMKEWHPDKFPNDPEKAAEAEVKSKTIIEAYHFLVSIAPETKEANLEEYALTINTSSIDDFEYKGSVMKIKFLDESAYEYFGVPKSVYLKMVNAANLNRFAKRHIFEAFVYRNVAKRKQQEA
jgi:curved DNA-binding protein CbpA